MRLIFTITATVLFLSAAGGQSWRRAALSTTSSLRGLSVVSATTVWASGTGGTVLRTVDGGEHWSVISVPGAERLDFRGIHAFDARTAVVISSGPAEDGQARIYRTTDAGATWIQVYQDQRKGVFFDAVAFRDRRHGIVLSDPVDGRFALFTTDDGGAAWKQIPPSGVPPALPNEGAFAASNSCLTVWGEKNVWFATGGASVARVFRSEDGGLHWSAAETPMHPANTSSGIFSLAFADAEHGIAVGGDYAHPGDSALPNILLTSDAGRTWQPAPATVPPGVFLSSVALGPGKGGKKGVLMAGSRGLFRAAAAGAPQPIKESDLELNAVAYDIHGGWAVGPKGLVIREKR